MKTETEIFIKKNFDNSWQYRIPEKGYRWLDEEQFHLTCSKNFVNLFNQIQLVLNYNSNLDMLEDLRHENGLSAYGIEIPLEYFRFPILNKENLYHKTHFPPEERRKIENVLSNSKERLNYSKDESVIAEVTARFEFLNLYSCFEGFCEEILIEKDFDKSNKSEKKHGDFIRHNNLLEIVKKVISIYDLGIYESINQSYRDFDSLTRLFYELRNLYTHRNGIVTRKFIESGLKSLAFLQEWLFDTELQKKIYVVKGLMGNYSIYEGKNFNCQLVVAYFRAYSTLLVELLNLEE
ncbi:hypothetical protein [uncultured Treponema sp.]|uniref:hypothetical protein n=1 Tax=uncultured Treponema sp. TaxID=162155 RepID=UPI0025926EE5|nr:hypothetical protein [uncultured Treponema sp.]